MRIFLEHLNVVWISFLGYEISFFFNLIEKFAGFRACGDFNMLRLKTAKKGSVNQRLCKGCCCEFPKFFKSFENRKVTFNRSFSPHYNLFQPFSFEFFLVFFIFYGFLWTNSSRHFHHCFFRLCHVKRKNKKVFAFLFLLPPVCIYEDLK